MFISVTSTTRKETNIFKFLLVHFVSTLQQERRPSIFNYSIVESLQSLSFSQWHTGPVDHLFASCHKGPGVQIPWGYLCETGILLLVLSHYIGDPDVIDHCGLVLNRH